MDFVFRVIDTRERNEPPKKKKNHLLVYKETHLKHAANIHSILHVLIVYSETTSGTTWWIHYIHTVSILRNIHKCTYGLTASEYSCVAERWIFPYHINNVSIVHTFARCLEHLSTQSLLFRMLNGLCALCFRNASCHLHSSIIQLWADS